MTILIGPWEKKWFPILLLSCHGTSRSVSIPNGSLLPLKGCLYRSVSLPCLFFFLVCSFLFLVLHDMNRRYLASMWEHSFSCSVKLHLSMPPSFLLGVIVCHCLSRQPGDIPAAKKESEVSGRGEFYSMWKPKERFVFECDKWWPVWLIAPLRDTNVHILFR